ncbi:MAG: hypothetical protein HZB39_04415 [Planctomycetes bacterium]|nr:hypothetical protein [Planctomycetota bacterium]
MRNLFPLALVLASSISAQSFLVPPGTSPTVGTCNVFPFGTSDMRYQALVRATELGNTPGVISGFALAPCSTGVRTMRAITVRFAHLNLGALSTTFDTNLNSPGPAQTVLDTVNHSWRMVANTWNSVGLQDPFFYNGSDDLVVEITVYGSSGVSGAMHREATNQRVYLGSYSGQPTGTNGGNTAFKMKLHFGDANTQLFGASCPGSVSTASFSFNGTAQLGTQLDLVVTNGPPSMPAYVLLGFDAHMPLFPMDLAVVNAQGCVLYHDVTVAVGVFSDPAGGSVLSLALPPIPSLAGLFFYSSAVLIDPAANAAGFTTTNYGRALLGN